MSDSPQMLLEQERLIREVTINSTIYTELKKCRCPNPAIERNLPLFGFRLVQRDSGRRNWEAGQQEIVKIEEIKNIPIINVMDDGRAAAKKEKPKRSTIALVIFFPYCY